MEVVTEAEGGSAQRWRAQRWIRADNDDNVHGSRLEFQGLEHNDGKEEF
jgi:hypothetical protein